MGRSSSKTTDDSAWTPTFMTAVAAGGVLTSAVAYYYYYWYGSPLSSQRRERRGQWYEQEEHEFGHDTLHSIIEHFKDFEVSETSTVKEANQRRTLSYYLKARQAHEQSLVLGIADKSKLIQLRQAELDHILRYHRQGTKSHRTVIVMLDQMTQRMLVEARHNILAPFQYCHDIDTARVWIPELNVLPPKDMHVTVAIPWWWHTMLQPNPDDNEASNRNPNYELSQALANRFRQALVMDFHYPFQVELERIILLGGKTLVALWRTVGSRAYPLRDASLALNVHVQDRHSPEIDPMVRLRREIVQCFTTENRDIQRKPLTYHDHKLSLFQATTHEHQHDAMQQDLFTTTFHSDESLANKSSSKQSTMATEVTTPLRAQSNDDNTPSTSTTATTKTSASSSFHRRTQSMPAFHTPEQEFQRLKLDRQPTIEFKTPGMGDGDGFIHTTLCRLPLDCLSSQDVELEPIHRLCREATAMYAGHRMLIHRFRFLETTGAGGESNPCIDPIFDESMDAPWQVQVDNTTGQVQVVLGAANISSSAQAPGKQSMHGNGNSASANTMEVNNNTIGGGAGNGMAAAAAAILNSNIREKDGNSTIYAAHPHHLQRGPQQVRSSTIGALPNLHGQSPSADTITTNNHQPVQTLFVDPRENNTSLEGLIAEHPTSSESNVNSNHNRTMTNATL